jgi:hypothetical protein
MLNGCHHIYFEKMTDQTPLSAGRTGRTSREWNGMAFGLLCIKNKYDDSHKGIYFIHLMMLNSNPKSNIQKNI